MTTLYTDEVKNLLKYLNSEYGWNKMGLRVDVLEYEENLTLRIYRDNFMTFDGVDQLRVAKQIGEAIEKVRKLGCPCVVEVLKNVPVE